MTKRDINLLKIVAGILLVVLVFGLVYIPNQSEIVKLESEIEQLEPELATREMHANNIELYETGIEDARNYMEETIEHYPSQILFEDYVMWILGWREDNDLVIPTITIGEPSLINSFQGIVVEDGQELQKQMDAYSMTLTTQIDLSYEELKSAIDDIYSNQHRTSLESLSLSYNANTGGLTGSFSINKYFMFYEGSEYVPEPLPNVNIGTDNIFGSVE